MSMLMPLSKVRSYTSTHLTEAAIHWDNAAEQWMGVYGQVHFEAQGLDWERMARESSMRRIAADHDVVRGNAESLQLAANIARTNAPTLDIMARSVAHLADEATENGFYVSETYDVQNIAPTANMAEKIAREEQAQQYSAQLKFRAGNFIKHEHQTAGDLVKAVDFKTDGGDYDPNQGGGNFERKFWNDVITDAIAGAVAGSLIDGVGAIPGAAAGGAWAAIKDGLHFIAGDGHDY